MAGYDIGYDWFYQEAPQEVALATAILVLAPQPLRVIAQNQPLISLSDRFVIIGQRYDLDARRFVQIAEQVIYSPAPVLALLWDERFEPEIGEPKLRLWDERFEPTIEEPKLRVWDERFET